MLEPSPRLKPLSPHPLGLSCFLLGNATLPLLVARFRHFLTLQALDQSNQAGDHNYNKIQKQLHNIGRTHVKMGRVK